MANRKLQGEIDRCLKKVSEGIEEFSELYDKIYATTNPSQKEKLEAELKREIKKLQRLRDQIKSWISSNEIKDKRALTDARKNIETQMERFKACEREMKTKQYSKEGLQAKEKLDPAEVARMEMSQWVTNTVDTLNTQVDALEAESELISAQKKRGKSDSNRLKEIEHHLERHKFHMTQLETMLRMMENDQLTVEDLESVKDSVEYYVESNNDPDFEEDLEMYDHLNLAEDEVVGYLEEHHHTAENAEKDEESAAITPSATATATKKRGSKDEVPVAPSPDSTASPAKKSLGKQAAAATVALKAKSPAVTGKATAAPLPSVTPAAAKPAAAAPSVKYSAAASVGLKSEKPGIPTTTPQNLTIIGGSKASNVTPESSLVTPSTSSAPEKPELSFSSVVQSAASRGLTSMASVVSSSSSLSPTNAGLAGEESRYPQYFADMVTSFESCQRKSFGRGDETLRNQFLLMLLESSYQQCPDIIDAERPPVVYTPSNSSRTTPSYYPKHPMLNLSVPAVIERFDLDTLFFLFYYRQNTREQLLAARELKRQSWRFHKKYLTWFQRHEEPKTITDDFEQGTYVYFDYEGAWCQRKKTEFTFEYQYLEGE